MSQPNDASAVPRFDQVNLVVDDMEATVAFYRLVGVDLPDAPEWPQGSGWRHTSVAADNGMRLEIDNDSFARVWAPASGGPGPVVIGLSLPSRAAVDDVYAAVVAAGHRGVQPPYDAFWGSRYAIVADPSGHHVGLMSPPDPDARYVPSVPESSHSSKVGPARTAPAPGSSEPSS